MKCVCGATIWKDGKTGRYVSVRSSQCGQGPTRGQDHKPEGK